MREADFHITQQYPTAMSMILSDIRIDCYWFLLINIGHFGALLHAIAPYSKIQQKNLFKNNCLYMPVGHLVQI